MTRNRKDKGLKIQPAADDLTVIDPLNDIPFEEPPASGSWVTDYAWVSGLMGAVMTVICAIFYSRTGALDNGVHFMGIQLTHTNIDSMLLALVVITASMLLTEGVRLWLRDPKNFFQLSPRLMAGRYLAFLREAVVNWLLYVCLLGLTVLFFRTAGEYGFSRNDSYYQIWFRFIELAFIAYLWGGLPYVLLTRAFKHDPVADRRDSSSLMARVLQFTVSLVPGLKNLRPRFNEVDKKAARALLVKLFFTPLMTVFFLDHFPHLVNNFTYMSTGLLDRIAGGHYTHASFNNDFFNISRPFIFSIDVALAWCGYVISSRWVDNQTVTAEPTVLGWVVCLICYPPFMFSSYGMYYSPPDEAMVLHLQNQTLVTIFVALSLLSIIVYMLATLWFGVRFSNVTNRGIIRKGPYAIVRHPAYAAKNIFWWTLVLPVLMYSGWKIALLMIMGLVLQSWVYYMRAMTEERHLSADPYYRAYCQQVRYRFIPGVI
ncbi:MAG TPA: isoprenylcysteine carboxylmethyltransferase family protein [Gammaproteobacteria bacterium]